MKKLFPIFLGIFLITASCKKNEETAATPIDLLTGGTTKTWALTGIKVDGKNELLDCDNDDTYVFNKTTSQATNNIGTKKCSATDANSTSSFALSADGKTLTLDGFGFTVVTLTSSDLQIKLTIFGQTQEITMKAK